MGFARIQPKCQRPALGYPGAMARRPASSAPPPTLDQTTRVALLLGKEAFVRDAYLNRLKLALEKAHGEIQIARFRGSECDIADVLDEARSFGLMVTHKLIIVSEAADLVTGETNRRAMERYAQSPTESATLALLADTWHKGKLDKMIAEVGAIVPCEALAEPDAMRWLEMRASKNHNAKIDRDAARLLVDRMGTSLQRLDSELAKLAADHPVIDEQAVRSLVGKTREEEVWGIQSDVLRATPDYAVGQLREAIEISRHPPVLISYALTDLTRKLHAMARGLDDRIPPQQLAKTLKLWGPAGRAIEESARKLGSQTAARLFREAIATDAAIKSGLGRPQRRLERLAMQIASSR